MVQLPPIQCSSLQRSTPTSPSSSSSPSPPLQVGPTQIDINPLTVTEGYPQYGPDYYDDEYDETQYDLEADDVEDEDLENMGKMAKMNTNGETFKVDAGTTIRMPCNIEHLPGKK